MRRTRFVAGFAAGYLAGVLSLYATALAVAWRHLTRRAR